MPSLQWGADELLWGEDELLWGSGLPPVHDVPHAAIVHTMGIVRYPDGALWPLWTGPGSALVTGDRAALRRGEVSWYDDPASPPLLDLPGRNPQDRITAAATDPHDSQKWVVVSSSAGKIWYHDGATTITITPDGTGNRPNWIPEGHHFYPVGGCSIMNDGTLVVAGWVGIRYASATATNGYRYPEGRWCFYLHRLREPGMETVPNDDYDPDAAAGTPEASETVVQPVVPATNSPPQVGFSLITRPFPTGDLRLRYDFSKFHASIQRYLRYRQEDAHDIVFFGYTNHTSSPDGNTGAQNSGLHGFVLKNESFLVADTVEDDGLPHDVSRTITVIGAPAWNERANYRSVTDDGQNSWWCRRDGTLESRVSFHQAVPVLQFLFSISRRGTDDLPSSVLPQHRLDDYTAVIVRSPEELWMVNRRTGAVTRMRTGLKLLSVASALTNVSPLRATRGVDDTERVNVSIILPNETDDGRALGPVDNATIWLDTVWSDDGGVSWHTLNRSFWGTLSKPEIQRNSEGAYVYNLEIYTPDSDTRRARPRYWDDANQKALYPEDRFFEGQSDIIDGARLDRWPPKVFV